MAPEWEYEKCATPDCPFVARAGGSCVYHSDESTGLSAFCDDITLRAKPCMAWHLAGEKKCRAHKEVSNYDLFFGHEEDELPLPPSPGMRKHVRKAAKKLR